MGKKGNIIPAYKENSKQIVDNYRPVSLLPICSKIFKKLIFDSIYEFLNKNNLFNNNHSGFKPNGSCIDQLIKLIKLFLNNRCQRVVLKGQSSVWKLVTAGVSQGSALGPLCFLIYINDLLLGLTINVKLFADDNSFFSVVSNASVSASRLNNDVVIGLSTGKCQDWDFNWKMLFNPDPTKQVKEAIFSKKQTNLWYSSFLIFQQFTN